MQLKKTKFKGVSYALRKNGDATFYITYRDERGKPKRTKVGRASEGFTAQEAFNRLELVLSDKQIIPSLKSNREKSLNDLADYYFSYQAELRFAREMQLFNDHKSKQVQYVDQIIKERQSDIYSKIKLQSDYLQELQRFSTTSAKKIQNYRKELLRYISSILKHNIADMPVEVVNKKHFNYFVLECKRAGKSEKTISDLLYRMRSIVSFAIEEEVYFGHNPFLDFKYKATKKESERFLSTEEIKLLLDTTRKANLNVYLCTYLGLISAGRANSILSIQKKDIDFDRKMLKLTNFKRKNSKYEVPLSDKSLVFLKDITENLKANDYLIRPTRAKDDKNRPLYKIPPKYYEICDDLFNRGIDKRLEPENVVNYHTLRHTVASQMAINGESIYAISKMLDHKNVEETQRYAKLQAQHLNDMVNNYVVKNLNI